MPRQVFSFDPPDRFIAGTVGQPGDRTFYLQASGGGRVVSVACEKAQVSVLAERLGELLDEVDRRLGPEAGVSGVAVTPDVAPLEAPIEEEFRVGTMALAWDADDRVVVVEAHAVGTGETDPAEPMTDDDSVEGPDLLRVRLPPALARAFVVRAELVVAAGRPPCPLCGLPLDPEGHICPRQNGHRH